MEEVKILYCYDENGKPIHYTKTIKDNKYFCIDCGAELIVKEGKIKTKHLAHKNTQNCGGTGESIFHKHWKENLFKAGMFINISNKFDKEKHCVEILEVLNEVSLNKRYNTNWDIEIIVDTLLITTEGDIVIEINYKNPKDWDKLKPYYDKLNILKVYEVTVGKNINDNLIWFDLYEKEYLTKYILQALKNNYLSKIRKSNKIYEFQILINFKNNIVKIDGHNLQLNCLLVQGKRYKHVILNFNLEETKLTEKQIIHNFKVSKGIMSISIKAKGEYSKISDYDVLNVIDFQDITEYPYEKNLYIKLCNLGNGKGKIKDTNIIIDKNEYKHTIFTFEFDLEKEGYYTDEDIKEMHNNAVELLKIEC